ncbi:MAG: sigma-54-dependent transcriptional regulator [Desulfovibrionales bacterium]
MPRILIIDDDEMFSGLLAEALGNTNYDVEVRDTLKRGLDAANENAFDCVLLDVRLPDGNGLDLIPYVRGTSSVPEVIIITGEGDPDGAELAIKSGAWDYIEKPASLNKMLLPISRALEYRKERNTRKRPTTINREMIVGQSFQINTCIEMVVEAAWDEGNVLITGPTGTGKEVFAKTLHGNSTRSMYNFVVVDCAALPENLVESALFGYRRGAFTGADRDQAGLVSQADKGTLFLDEVGEMPLAIQKSFLRVLQEHRFRALGSTREVTSDFRVIAATNRNLEEMVQKGTFREDLLYRLRSHSIDLPPLVDREGDIKELALWFMEQACKRRLISPKGYSPEFMDALNAYPWPGNVRELKNAMEKSVSSARYESILYPTHLPMEIRIFLAKNAIAPSETHPKVTTEWKIHKERVLEREEGIYFASLFASCKGDVRTMAEKAGLTRARVYSIIKKHSIT